MAIEPFIENLTELTDPEAGDYVAAVDDDAPAGDKDRKLDLARLAILAQANTFLAANTFEAATTFEANQRINALVGVNKSPSSNAQIDILSGAAGRIALRVRPAVSASAPPFQVQTDGGALIATLGGTGSNYDPTIGLTTSNLDNGTDVGTRIFLGRNNNGSTPAAGHIMMTNLGSVIYRIWPDASGNLRIWNNNPTNANDGLGVVVGSQTSAAAAKDIDETLPDWRESINYIIEAVQAGALRSWKYKSGAYNNEHYPIGIVTDYAGRYGMDRGASSPYGRSLNIAVAIGDLMGAVVTLAERVTELEGKLNG